jgi:hypothetical protein
MALRAGRVGVDPSQVDSRGKIKEGGASPYVLPTASGSTKGGVKIGSGLTMTGETLSADAQVPAYAAAQSGKYLSVDANGDLVWSDGPGGGGAEILSGAFIPLDSQGSDGDLYLQTTPASITNSSGQYINTGYSGGDSSKYVMDFILTKNQSTKYPAVFGGRPSTSVSQNAAAVFFGFNNDYEKINLAWGSGEHQAFNFGNFAVAGKLLHLELSAGTMLLTVDGDVHEYTFTPTSISGTTAVGIFAMIINGAVQDYSYTNGIKLFRFGIYEGDTLVHDFKPTQNNGVACVYDEIAQEYKYLSGSGAFVYEAENDNILASYVKVNGSWQSLKGTDIDDVNMGM